MTLNDKQRAALLRGVLAVGIAVLTSVIGGLTGHVAMPIIALSAMLQGLIALRTFVDGSAERAKEPEREKDAAV